jgi:hypothetical protein
LFSAASSSDFCPVCILRGALNEESAVATVLNPASGSEQGSEEGQVDVAGPRFEHYEPTLAAKGGPVELGRGAMGVNYKAFDVDLCCPVTLKKPLRVGTILRKTLQGLRTTVNRRWTLHH